MEKLKVINLAKSYDRDVPVLRDISFCVDDRDFCYSWTIGLWKNNPLKYYRRSRRYKWWRDIH